MTRRRKLLMWWALHGPRYPIARALFVVGFAVFAASPAIAYSAFSASTRGAACIGIFLLGCAIMRVGEMSVWRRPWGRG